MSLPECPICLSDEEREWSALGCGHVFHKNCAEKGIKHSNRCPICREEVKRTCRFPIKLYFQQPGSQERGGDPDVVNLAEDEDHLDATRLQSKLVQAQTINARYKSEIEILRIGQQESTEHIDELQKEVVTLKDRLRNCESRLEAAIKESNVQATKAERLQKEAHHLKVRLEHEKILNSRLQVAMDPALLGAPLAELLTNMAAGGAPAPDYFHKMLDSRNRALIEANTRAIKAESAQVAAEARAQETISKLQREIQDLKADFMREPGMQGNNSRIASDAQRKQQLPWQGRHACRNQFNSSARGKQVKLSNEGLENSTTIIDEDSGELPWQSSLPTAFKKPSKPCTNTIGVRIGAIKQGETVSLLSDEEWEDEINENTSNGRPVKSMLVHAGPSRLGLAAAPGSSFIRRAEFANTGFSDDAAFIHKAPNGRGGSVTLYKTGSDSLLTEKRSNVQHGITAGHSTKRNKTANSSDMKIDNFFGKQPK